MYITLEEAQERYGKRLTETVLYWDGSDFVEQDIYDDTTNVTRAIEQATDYIDSFNWTGKKKDEEQENEFPRSFQPEVPEKVKKATFQLSLLFLKEYYQTQYMADQPRRYKQSGAERYTIEIGDTSENIHFTDKSDEAERIVRFYLKRYLRGNYRITNLRY